MRSDITIAAFRCEDRQRGPARFIKIMWKGSACKGVGN